MTDPPLELFITDKAFRPNPTTVRFARAIQAKPGDVVFDIGTGVAPLALKCAMDGASQVVGVDPVPLHCELARMNVAKYGLEDVVSIYEGCFFEPFEQEAALKGLQADIIIGDVSGIADGVARALGWYSDEVPTGGADGTKVIIEFLRSAGPYLKPAGSIYFPIAIDLSDSAKIYQAADELFGSVVNAFGKDSFSFPLTEEEISAIKRAYAGSPPDFIKIQQERRPSWRGQIWRASKPR